MGVSPRPKGQRPIVQQQAKLDIMAGISILLMFIGAFILPATALGFLLIGGGGAAMVILFVVTALGRR